VLEHFDVLIVGAGLSGIDAAYHLQKICPTKGYVILEQRERIGIRSALGRARKRFVPGKVSAITSQLPRAKKASTVTSVSIIGFNALPGPHKRRSGPSKRCANGEAEVTSRSRSS